MQDALRSANAQIRMLRAEVAALHEEIDCCGASAPPTPPSVPPSAGGFQGGDAAETKDDSGDVRTEGEADAASAQQDVKELEVWTSAILVAVVQALIIAQSEFLAVKIKTRKVTQRLYRMRP